MLDLFWDPKPAACSPPAIDGEALVTRPKDLLDNATPSANSLAALGLLRLAALTGERRYLNHAEQILASGRLARGDTPARVSRAAQRRRLPPLGRDRDRDRG